MNWQGGTRKRKIKLKQRTGRKERASKKKRNQKLRTRVIKSNLTEKKENMGASPNAKPLRNKG